jgi:hypothetical protein
VTPSRIGSGALPWNLTVEDIEALVQVLGAGAQDFGSGVVR